MRKKEIFLKNLAFYDYEKSNECTSLMIEFKNEKIKLNNFRIIKCVAYVEFIVLIKNNR